jgi:uncharacterized protein with HEPN domain
MGKKINKKSEDNLSVKQNPYALHTLKDNYYYLEHYVISALKLIQNLDFESFKNDEEKISLVRFCLISISELSERIMQNPINFHINEPQFKWNELVNLKDYQEADAKSIWIMVKFNIVYLINVFIEFRSRFKNNRFGIVTMEDLFLFAHRLSF